MKKEKLLEILISESENLDGKKILFCEKAHEISKVNNVSLSEIGTLCNEKGIRIKKCQLGCF